MTTTFEIPIGDWSDDGHGRCSHYSIQTDKTLAEVQKAYDAAKKRFPGLDPEKFAEDYEDNSVPQSVIDAAKKWGLKIDDVIEPNYEDEENFHIDADGMIKYVCRFIMLVDPDLNLKVAKSKNRLHTHHIGYGLFH